MNDYAITAERPAYNGRYIMTDQEAAADLAAYLRAQNETAEERAAWRRVMIQDAEDQEDWAAHQDEVDRAHAASNGTL